MLLAAAVIAGLAIPRRRRPAGRPQPVSDIDQLAYLAGGRERFVDATVTRLLVSRTLVMDKKDRFIVAARAGGDSAAAIAVLALPAPIDWRAIAAKLTSYAEPLERRLAATGLLMDAAETFDMRLRQTMPYLALLAFGSIKLAVGTFRDRPVGFLAVLLVVTLGLAAIRWFVVDRRTRAGIDAVTQAQSRAERLRRAPTAMETGEAVALFGTVVLVGSTWSTFHDLRTSGGGSDGGTSTCGGGSDGGGGGCGGCGGGGD